MTDIDLSRFTWQTTIGRETYDLCPLSRVMSIARAEIELGFAPYWVKCRLAYAKRNGPKAVPPPVMDDLVRTGLCQMKVLSPERCADLRARIDAAGGRIRTQDYDLDHVREVLSEVFSPAVDAVIRNHFECDYYVPFLNFFRTDPGMRDSSYNWHCDWGPQPHLKLFCYIAPADSHDGATIFVDRETTRLLTKLGYVFGQGVDRRNEDIGPLCGAFGIPYAPMELRPNEGEAAIFEPAQIFHRGKAPTRGHRYVLQVAIMPSPEPWQVMLERFGEGVRNNFSDFPLAQRLLDGVWETY